MNDIHTAPYTENAPVSPTRTPAAPQAAPARTFEIEIPDGEKRHFTTAQDIRGAILAGELPRGATIGGTALPGSKPGLTVEAWARKNEAMRPLYEPVWSHTMKGALYGALIVGALKLLETFVEIARVNPGAALLFAIVMAFMASPKYKPQIAIAGFMVWRQSNVPFQAISMFLGIPFGVCLFAVTFGASLGMVVGTIVGYARRRSAGTAPDAAPEGSKPAIWGLAVPASVFAGAVAAYIYVVMPWMVRSMGKGE